MTVHGTRSPIPDMAKTASRCASSTEGFPAVPLPRAPTPPALVPECLDHRAVDSMHARRPVKACSAFMSRNKLYMVLDIFIWIAVTASALPLRE